MNKLIIPDTASLHVAMDSHIFNGTYVIQGEGIYFAPTTDSLGFQCEKRAFTAIPYNVWDNRGAAKMRVWFPENVAETKFSEE
jgi:DUF1680 family protein